MQRAPLLTSSTESFRSGLTGYAQLQAPKSTSPQKATKVCCCLLSAAHLSCLSLMRPCQPTYQSAKPLAGQVHPERLTDVSACISAVQGGVKWLFCVDLVSPYALARLTCLSLIRLSVSHMVALEGD